MFAGVAPFSIVIAKNSKAKKIVSVEINREASKYAKLNVELNNLKDRVEIFQGDIKRISEKLKNKFDVIVMPRPQLKDTFLKQAFILSKKGTRIYYYDFTKNFSKKNFGATKSESCRGKDFVGCNIDGKELIVEKIKNEAKQFRKKIKILKVKSAGEIAPYKMRLRIDFAVL
jgi:tRNA G37 N-methylase Trm5